MTSSAVQFIPPMENPLTPNVSLHSLGKSPSTQDIEQDEGGTQEYYATPWKDWNNDPYEKTWEKRGKYYMGCTSAGIVEGIMPLIMAYLFVYRYKDAWLFGDCDFKNS